MDLPLHNVTHLKGSITMKKTYVTLILVLIMLVTVSVASASPPEEANFTAPLSGGEEVPSVDTNAAGLAHFQLSKDGTALHFKLNVANIQASTQAHIHCGAAGVNGPVVAFLYGFGPVVTANGTLSEGTITSVTPRP